MSSGSMAFLPRKIKWDTVKYILVSLANPDKTININDVDLFLKEKYKTKFENLYDTQESLFSLVDIVLSESSNIKDSFFSENEILEYFDNNFCFYDLNVKKYKKEFSENEVRLLFNNIDFDSIDKIIYMPSSPIHYFVLEKTCQLLGGFCMAVDNNHEISAIQSQPLFQNDEDIIFHINNIFQSLILEYQDFDRFVSLARYEEEQKNLKNLSIFIESKKLLDKTNKNSKINKNKLL